MASAPPRPIAEQQRLHDALRELFERQIPFNRLLGLRIDSFDPAGPRIGFSMHEQLVGHFVHGRLHGGVISAALDATAGFSIMLAIAAKHADEAVDQVMMRFARMGTIDLRVDFLRPGVGGEFIAGARVTRLGGRIASAQMSLESVDGALLATGAAAYVIS